MTTSSTVPVTSRQGAGYVLGILVGLANIPGAFIPAGDDGAGPPVAVLVVSLVLGVLTVALLALAWRTRSRGALRASAVLLVINVITSLPAFFVSGVQAWVRLVAGLFVLASVAALVLLFSPDGRGDRVPA
ncbi:hypothetical protein EV189_0348 [Motilibacter rhizosphaerae]|uniref:Uncharacterized protein n=1 Tax=Motilibacter rhizosphaerae TaxID=598652 RepID=A0A4Q7NVC7_9ACTN|nr:hypothetical protein [Motilibacter rhizosphaerae]RZS91115.1 hypothetical protein EV189_0348 [Motilibacter rhizosphaerae]